MVCIYCGTDTQVINSRLQRRANHVWRRRKCPACGAVFTTTEAAAYEGSWRVREQNGHLMPFQQNKLLISLYKSLEHRQSALDDATALLGTILGKLRVSAHDGVLEPQNIAETAHGVLAHFDTPAAVSYRAFHPLKSK